MIKKIFKINFVKVFKFSFILLVIISYFYLAKITHAAEVQNFSKTDVEKIIHDYLLDNPDIILKSISGYQTKSSKDKQNQSLIKYKEYIFNDPISPEAGNKNGDVTIVEFLDNNCHYCKAASKTIRALMSDDKNLRIVFKELPILSDSSKVAAKWVLAANKQGKYFEFHTALMKNRRAITDDLLESIAKDLKLDVKKLKEDMNRDSVSKQIKDVRFLATKLGLTGTPAFIIDGKVKFGAMSLDEFKERIADARANKKESK